VPIRLDSELQFGGDPSQLTTFPYLLLERARRAFHRAQDRRGGYRCQFFYSEAEPYGTGKDEYDNLDNCVLTLLQVQADHGRQLANVSSGATAANLNENDYHGPLVV